MVIYDRALAALESDPAWSCLQARVRRSRQVATSPLSLTDASPLDRWSCLRLAQRHGLAHGSPGGAQRRCQHDGVAPIRLEGVCILRRRSYDVRHIILEPL